MKRLFILLAIMVLIGTISATVYLTEGFESAFVGSPAAPSGWTQTMNRPVMHATAEKDWLQNVVTAGTWAPLTSGTKPTAAYEGTAVLCIDDYNYNSSSIPQNSRRMESPAMNLTSSTSPYIRFWYYNNQGVGITLNLRVVVSGNGGATWDLLTPIVNGFDTANTTWNRISIAIPAAYRTANFKFGFEITNRWGTNNPFIDDVVVEDYTPTTIVSAASGDWNAAATWVGGVIPTANNHVEIAAGHTVTVTNATTTTGIIARCQNLTVNGTLAHGAGTSNLLHAFGNIVVNGTFNAFNSTSGRIVYCGGSFTVNGGATANFSVGTTVQTTGSTTISTGAAGIVWLGNQAASFNNSGTLTSDRIGNLLHMNPSGVTYNANVTAPYTVGLYLGAVNPNGRLTLGNAPSSGVTQVVERANGSFTSNPIWNNTNITARSNYYYSPNWVPLTQTTITAGNEIELIGPNRTVSGAFTMNTHNNLQLAYPLTLGTATTGTWTLTRGIVITDHTNQVTTTAFHTSTGGIAPSTATPPTNHGSYFAGPLRRTYGTTNVSRIFPLGVGTDFNGATPNANVLKSVTLAPGANAASQSPTISIVGPPSGSVNAPITTVFSPRAYKIELNGEPDFAATATLTLNGMNYQYGNSDNLAGTVDQLRIAQSPALTGPWSERSASSGSGAIATNTVITRTTSSGAPGPIAPFAATGGFFAWGSTIPLSPVCVITPNADKNFGNVEIGTYLEQVYTIANNGGSTLSVSSVQLTGADVTQYTLYNSNGASFDIPVGSSVQVTVRFNPIIVGGPWPINLVVNHNGTPSSNSVNITGAGIYTPPLAYPVLEGFEAGFVNLVNTTGNTVNWTINTTFQSEGAQAAYNAYGASNTNRLITASYFDLTTTTMPILTFDQIAKTENNYDHCYVEISTNRGTTWTILPASAYEGAGTYATPTYNTPEGPCFMESSYTDWQTGVAVNPTNTWWKSEKFNLSAYRAFNGVMIRFRLKSDSSVQRYGWLIDNVAIKEAPAYDFAVTIPANAQAIAGVPYNYTVNIQNQGSSADNFTPSIVGGGAWTYGLYQADGTTPLVGTINIPAGGNSNYVIKVTSPSTGVSTGDTDVQNFRVTSAGNGAVEDFALTTTVIVPITAPHSENFDAVTTPNLPLGWSKLIYHPTSTFATVTTYATTPYSTPNCVQMYNSSTLNATAQVMLITPPITGSLAGLYLDFYVKRGASAENLLIGTMTDPANAATFTQIASITPTTSWAQQIISLSGATPGDQYIVFKHANTVATRYIYLDDIMLRSPYTGNDILTYTFPQATGPAVINPATHSVNIEVQVGTNPASLVANYTLSPGAVAFVENSEGEYIPQVSGVTVNNFSEPIIYTIESENNIQQSWEVTVTVAAVQSDEKQILAYSLPQQTGPATINPANHTVNIQVAYLTSLTNLIATFTLSPFATAWIDNGLGRVLVQQTSGVTANNFTNPVTYIIRAENGTEQAWVVTVSVAPPALGENISNPFIIPSLPFTGTGDTSTFNHDYGPYGPVSGMINLLNTPMGTLYSATNPFATTSKDVVYRLTLTEPTLLSIDLRTGTTWDTAVALLTAPGTGPENVLLINDDYTGVRVLQSYVDSGSNYVPAGTYYILVGAYSSASGPYQITVNAATPPVAPDVDVAINTVTNKVILSWTQNPVMRYNIYSDTNPYGSFSTVVATNVNAGTYEIIGIPAVNTFYRVTEVFKFLDSRETPFQDEYFGLSKE